MEDLPREVFEMVLRYLSPLDVVPLVGCSRGLLDRLQGFEMVDCFPYYQSTLLARKDQDKCIWKWSMGKKFTLGEEWFDLHYEWYQDFPEILHTVEELKLTATGDFFPQALEGLDLFVNVRYIECEGLESMHFGPNSAQEFAKLTKLQVLRLNSTYQCFEDEDYQVLAELARRHSLIELRLNMWEKTWLEGLECAGGWLGLKHLTVRQYEGLDFVRLFKALPVESLEKLTLLNRRGEENKQETLLSARAAMNAQGFIQCDVVVVN